MAMQGYYTALFPYRFLQVLYNICDGLGQPFLWTITKCLAPFMPTTKELQSPMRLLLRRVLLSPIYFMLIFLTLLPGVASFTGRIILHQFKRPYVVSEKLSTHDTSSTRDSGTLVKPEDEFSLATINTCLMLDLLSRANNNSDTSWRAKELAERIVVDQLFYPGIHTFKSDNRTKTHNALEKKTKSSSENSTVHPDFIHDIVTHFPKLDFICFQEMWDPTFTEIAVKELHKVYPWVVHDVGMNSAKINYHVFNSGLMFASRFPILCVDFKVFTSSCNYCRYNSKGLLMVKVR
jgi:sphingomyelin phosphodiesterase 3